MRRDAEVKIKGTFLIKDTNKIDLQDYWHYFNGGSATKIELYPHVRIIKDDKEIGFDGHIHTIGGKSQLDLSNDVIEYLNLKEGDEVIMKFKFEISK